MIEGVQVMPLKQIIDERGKVMHMLRCDAAHFKQFGEIYFSWVNVGIVKAWHKHLEMTLNYAVPVGCLKVVLFDDRLNSTTRGKVQEFFLSSDNYQLLVIPPNLWYGFKAVGNNPAMVANCASIPHRADEVVRCDPFDSTIPYNWSLKHG
jgi:dTDP-4-dehydrorhamnose 3,5-epimerase